MSVRPVSATDRASARWGISDSGLNDALLIEVFAAQQRARNLAESTIRRRSLQLGAFARWAETPLIDADLHHLRGYIGRPGLAPASRRIERDTLRAFYGFLVDDEYRADDPTSKLAPVRVKRGDPRPFAAEHISDMLTSGAYGRTRAMILLGYHQGFRAAQIARVHGHDFDLAAMTVRTVGKGGKERVLPLHPVIADLARTMPRDGWWFPARGARRGQGHILPGSVSQRITLAKRRAGIRDPKLTGHSLRHSFGTELVEAGVDVRVVQELMMHDDLGTTQIYTRVSPRLMREAIKSLPGVEPPDRSGRRAA